MDQLVIGPCRPWISWSLVLAGHGSVGHWSSFSRPQVAAPPPSNTYHLRFSVNVPDADYDTQEVDGGGGYAVAGGGNTAGVEGDHMAKHEGNLTKAAPGTLVTTVTKKEAEATVVARPVPPT